MHSLEPRLSVQDFVLQRWKATRQNPGLEARKWRPALQEEMSCID